MSDMDRIDVKPRLIWSIFTALDKLPFWASRPFFYALFSITPETPRDLWYSDETIDPYRLIRPIFLWTIVASFCFLTIFCAMSGTLLRDREPTTLMLLEDKWNIALYIFVVPGYVSYGLAIVSQSNRYFQTFDYDFSGSRALTLLRRGRFFLVTLLILFASSYFISKYQQDAMFIKSLLCHEDTCKPVLYWFMSRNNNILSLNQAGIYYLILNFVLLLTSISVAISYLTLAFHACRDTKHVVHTDVKKITAQIVRLKYFANASFMAQISALFYIVNAMIWCKSPLASSTSDNIELTVLAIVFFGVVCTQFPKTYITYKMMALRMRLVELNDPAVDIKVVPDVGANLIFAVNLIYGLLSISFISYIYRDFQIDPVSYIYRFFDIVFG